MTTAAAVALVVRCGLVLLFLPFSALDKILAFDHADRASALVIAGYCAATAVLYKQFWTQGDFWSDPDGNGRTLFWDFLKNLSLGAGFLLIVVGTDGSGLAPFLTHPFASSHPFGIHP